MNSTIKLLAVGLLFLFAACSQQSAVITTVAAFDAAIKKAQPGDTIVLAAQVWTDAVLKFSAKGTAEKPIVIRAEREGETILEGTSSLAFGGEYIEISGLKFTNGTEQPTSVIMFRNGKDFAFNSRITSCVIDDYNPANRFDESIWVELYGQNNRVDHCYFGNKLNAGVTLVVKLNDEQNQKNNHRIEYNYFGNRPRLGSNGGETIRVGVSTFSLTSSNTQITHNYFERCSGEVEIISIKSCDNVISNNTFVECEGIVTLRHGNRNTLENNIFLGNNKANTGGIRVINAGHTIRNNHFQDLKGDRFRSAFPIMNGVPNSAINRYHQVKDVEVSNNVFVNCDNIAFGIGADNERTATPQNVTFANNTLYNPASDTVFQAMADISGITFAGNKVTTRSGNFAHEGFENVAMTFTKAVNGLWTTPGYEPTMAATPEVCGPRWFAPQPIDKNFFATGTTIQVQPTDNLTTVAQSAAKGDVLELAEGETYILTETIIADKNLTIRSTNAANQATIKYETNKGGMPHVAIVSGGELRLENIIFDGLSKDGICESSIVTDSKPMIRHYNLFVNNCKFVNYDKGGASAFTSTPNTFADSVVFANCEFSNISGTAISLTSEKEDKGRYSAENVILDNCLFYDIMGSALDIYRGGNDESTTGPYLTVNHCTFHNVCNRELGSVLYIFGVQWAEIFNCNFSDSGRSGRAIKLEDPWWMHCTINNINLYESGKLESFYDNRFGNNILHELPMFEDIENGDFSVKADSALRRKSSGSDYLGYRKK